MPGNTAPQTPAAAPAGGGDPIASNVNKIFQMIQDQQPPAHTGKAVWAKDLDAAKACGVRNMSDLFGKPEDNPNARGSHHPINLGSKSGTRFLTDEQRIRMFTFKKLFHNVEVQAGFMNKGVVNLHTMQGAPLWREFEAAAKAYDVTDFAEFIPKTAARFYFEELEVPWLLADLFDTLPMDSPVVHVPGFGGLPEGKEEGDAAIFDESSNSDAGYDVHARNNVFHQRITEDLIADSAPSIIDRLRLEGAKAVARSFERAIINGDTTDTGTGRGSGHMDTDIRATAKHFSKAFNGLRKLAFLNSANGAVYDHEGAAVNKALFVALLSAQGSYADDKTLVKIIMGSAMGNAVLTGSVPELFTWQNTGALSPALTGQMPPIFGQQTVQSRFVRQDLNASGVYEAASALTIALAVRIDRFANWVRAPMRQWATPSLANTDQLLMATKIRHAWAGNPQTAVEKGVVMAINVAVA